MIAHVAFAVATDESRQILTGSLLEVNRSEARLVALDGFRLAMYKLSSLLSWRTGWKSSRL
jgi:DNA polymerase-3 subunit beta